jgi:hypothetical protein
LRTDTTGGRHDAGWQHGLDDHGATWRDSAGAKFVLWEPYGCSGDELAYLIPLAREDGIRVRLTSSVWNPPGTVGIRFDRANGGA